jgi:non-ribosomal peptide synthetase-like protein
MWTWEVWKTEAVTSIYEALSVPFFLEFMRGTPFLPIFLRLMGVKIGKMTYIDSTDFTEFDLVELGDYSAINFDAGPQTHLFEDRIMKIGAIRIGKNTSIGARTVILFDTEIGKSCRLGALSLVMKGEKIPSNTSWSGIPIK